MATWLKQSTQVIARFGPFLDKTDGVTEEVGLAATATEISKNHAAFGTGPTLGTHDADGWYPITLTTTHTDTLGPLIVKAHDAATHLPVWREFMVVPASAYDGLVGDSGVGVRADVRGWLGTTPATPTVAGVPEVDVTHVVGFVQTAGDIGDINSKVTDINGDTNDMLVKIGLPSNFGSGATLSGNHIDMEDKTDPLELVQGIADSGSTTTMVDAARTEADTDYWKGCLIYFASGNIVSQVRLITAFDPATDTITFAPATTQAVTTQDYKIVVAGRVDLELWDGSAVNGLVSGRVDASIGAVAANAITAAAIATDAIDGDAVAASAVTEIQSGLATSAALATVQADTDDIQARLPAALSGGRMNSDVQAINNNADPVSRLERSARSIVKGTVGAASTTTSIVTSSLDPAATAADQFKGRIVIFDQATTTAALRGQGTDITASSAAGVLTVSALTTAPVSGDTFVIV